MKKRGFILLSSFFLFVCFLLPVQAQSAFIIHQLDIHMQIAEDGTYTIEELYHINFHEESHGFFRSIPTKYRMEWTDPETGNISERNYYFPIDGIDCGGTQCEVEYESGGVSIRLGDPDRYVNGEQEYRITYQVHTKDLNYQGMQMLYWNLVGNGFDTTIRHVNYTIAFPKAFDANKISAYTGLYGTAFDDINYTVDGNTIYGEVSEPLYAHESATIMVYLPSDYFTFPPTPDYLMIALIASVVVLLISALLFWRFGKDDDVIVTVEFEAPDGLDSAAVGYIVDAIADQKDILSLIINWANRGYLKIHEDSDHHMILEKCKEMEKEDSTPYEREFFQAIFKKKDLVDEEDLKEKHVSHGLNNAMTMLSNYFHTKKRRVFTSSSMPLQFFMGVMVALPTLFFVFGAAYAHYGIMELCWSAVLLAIIAFVVSFPWMMLMRKRYVMKKAVFFLVWGLCFFLDAIVFTISAVFIILWGPEFAWLYALGYLGMEIILLFLLMFMDKRTKQGNRWLGQILGLKEFILTCEKERLELLAQENPSAFYDILPYAYVLGVSDVWAKKFESIILPQPQWYDSSMYDGRAFTTWIWWSSFNRSFHNVSSAATYVEPSGNSGFGGGSIGGGFSGGGFSGGGFGGGGGGSW